MTSTKERIEKRREELLKLADDCERKITALRREREDHIDRFFEWFNRWLQDPSGTTKSDKDRKAATELAVSAGIPEIVFLNLLDERNAQNQKERIEVIKRMRHSFFLTLRRLTSEARNYRRLAKTLKSIVPSQGYGS